MHTGVPSHRSQDALGVSELAQDTNTEAGSSMPQESRLTRGGPPLQRGEGGVLSHGTQQRPRPRDRVLSPESLPEYTLRADAEALVQFSLYFLHASFPHLFS